MSDDEIKSESGSNSESIHSDIESDDESTDLIMAFKYDMSGSGLIYSGDSKDDLDSFISRFNDFSKLKDFNNEKSILALNACIQGHARIFLDTILAENKNSLVKIQQLLKENFEGPSWEWAMESQLLNRKQQQSESLDSYVADIMLRCRQLKKSDKEMLSVFLRGLLPSLRAFVMSKQPVTFKDALDAARLGVAVEGTCRLNEATSTKVNVIQSREKVQLQTSVDTLTNLVSHMASRLDRLEQLPSVSPQLWNKGPQSWDGNSQSGTKGPQSRVKSSQFRDEGPRVRSPGEQGQYQRTMICWRCGFNGHRQKNCYANRHKNGSPLN